MSEDEDHIKDLKSQYLEKKGMVQTSIYIDRETYRELTECCKKLNEKKSTIIKIALMKFMKEFKT